MGEKFDGHRQLESLQEYVLIFQESQCVECRRRTSGNTWETVIYGAGDCADRSAKGDRVLLKSIDLEFAITELYRGLDG